MASDNKTEAAASAVPAVIAKKLTLEKKFAEMKRKAEAGDAKAQRNLAMMYGRGEAKTTDILYGKPEISDVGPLAERRVPPADCPVV